MHGQIRNRDRGGIPGFSPPSFVLRAVFADGDRSEVIGTVPLTCKYKIVESVLPG